MLGPLDEYPVHQVPQPIAWPGSSDRNFYDRSYFNAHDRTGNIFVITGIGYYPNLGVKDAFLLVARRGVGRSGGSGDEQTAVHLSDAIDSDRLNQRVNGYRVDVIEPLQKLRITLEETEGISCDLTWTGLFGVVQEQRHVMRSGTRVTLDAQRFAQLGSWSGNLVIDGQEITVDPATWIGTRDRSWGIRPIGEPEPAEGDGVDGQAGRVGERCRHLTGFGVVGDDDEDAAGGAFDDAGEHRHGGRVGPGDILDDEHEDGAGLRHVQEEVGGVLLEALQLRAGAPRAVVGGAPLGKVGAEAVDDLLLALVEGGPPRREEAHEFGDGAEGLPAVLDAGADGRAPTLQLRGGLQLGDEA